MSRCDPVLSLHGFCLHFSLSVLLGPSVSILTTQKAFPEPMGQLGWVAMEVGFQTSHWFKVVQPRDFQRWHLESAWRFSCHVSSGALFKLGLVAGFTQTTLPPLVFPGVCQWLTGGPSLQGRHTAVIKGLVEERRS